MVEKQVEFLCSIASILSNQDETQALLKSCYLMRCKDISRGFGLPVKQFSTITRCPHCCTEWRHASDSKINSLKISKSKKRRFKKNNKQDSNCLLHSNQLESTCSFCKHKTITPLVKPDRKKIKLPITRNISNPPKEKIITEIKPNNTNVKNNKNKKIKEQSKSNPINAYSKAKDIFSLQNNNNSLSKDKPIPIKTNKKKKDKFAGLCQQAVLSAAKHKDKQKKDKLSLFLKPSL